MILYGFYAISTWSDTFFMGEEWDATRRFDLNAMKQIFHISKVTCFLKMSKILIYSPPKCSFFLILHDKFKYKKLKLWGSIILAEVLRRLKSNSKCYAKIGLTSLIE